MSTQLEQRNPTIVKIVVSSISGLAFVCLLTICACALLDRNPGAEISTALITTLSTLVGSLAGLLVNTKTVPPVNAAATPPPATPPPATPAPAE